MTAWDEFAARMGVADFKDALFPYARRCALLARTERDVRVVGASRLAGMADLPENIRWPSVDDVPMALALQLNLADIAAFEIPGLPLDGWLWLFLDDEGDGDDPFVVGHRVIYADSNAPLQRREQPRPRGRASTYEARTPIWTPSFTVELPELNELPPELDDARLDEIVTDRMTAIGGARPGWCESGALEAALDAAGLSDASLYAHLTDEGFDEEIERHRTAIPEWAHAHAAYLEEVVRPAVAEYRRRRAEIDRRATGFHTLFLVGSEADVGWSWVDAGVLEVLIHDDDLRDRRFDKTYIRVCST